MDFTLSQAAKEAGVSKSTLSKAVNSGRLSAERLSGGSFRIEASELFRVFPQRTVETVTGTVREHDRTPPEHPTAELVTMRLKVEMLEAQLARERELRDQERETSQETVGDLRRRLDRSEDRILALTASQDMRGSQGVSPVHAVAPVQPDLPRTRGGFLSRLFSRS